MSERIVPAANVVRCMRAKEGQQLYAETQVHKTYRYYQRNALLIKPRWFGDVAISSLYTQEAKQERKMIAIMPKT